MLLVLLRYGVCSFLEEYTKRLDAEFKYLVIFFHFSKINSVNVKKIIHHIINAICLQASGFTRADTPSGGMTVYSIAAYKIKRVLYYQ